MDFQKKLKGLNKSIDRTNENMSSLVVNHKVEVGQQIFKFRKDYYEMLSTVNDNNETMKKFKEEFLKYEVQVKVRLVLTFS